MKRIGMLLIALACLCSAFSWPVIVQAAPSVSTHAEAAALIDVRSGRVLYSRQGDKPMRVASLTKVMTAIVAIENGKLSSMVKVGKNAFRKEGSSIYLRLNEEMSLQHLLYGMMLRSGNDAATAIAEHVGGTLDGFVYMMNEKAKMIGMTHSSFKNPHGLDAEGHYSTANDMAMLTAYALRNPVFQEIVKTKVKKAPNPNERWDYNWLNKNKMLHIYEGADGVKTGYTKLAKRCLISSATRNGQQLAVVTLNDSDDWADHAKLLDYGFKNYPLETFIRKGDAVQGSDYVAGADFAYPALNEEKSRISSKIVLNAANSTSFRLGEAGRLQYLIDGKEIGHVVLLPKDSPRLKQKEGSAFSFTESSAGESSLFEKWLYHLHFLVRVLFLGRSN
ncbi:D-alanyl-D-alanine carboxypeptidase family protein [Paenibacillus piri]|uniref:D-alanyl-D-alanine carboxypeptidase n=1 Tax=Paenibacillus piri TaxID=2547395 RepID=A0A4R5KTV1_9BACL|nr:D-alanyl-D-alanine carboxypeptidase family protein [Paenibacillus piri]TDF99301.1 D-alanyl-D-alanine carboxypeptidase [Paenibacillus piri]